MQFGPYQLEQELARGGMGAVYLARGPDGEQVAIKLLLEQSYPDPELERRFWREAEALEALEHPSCVEALGLRGACYVALQQYMEAIADFDAVLALDPKNVKALLSRGRCKAVPVACRPALDRPPQSGLACLKPARGVGGIA